MCVYFFLNSINQIQINKGHHLALAHRLIKPSSDAPAEDTVRKDRLRSHIQDEGHVRRQGKEEEG